MVAVTDTGKAGDRISAAVSSVAINLGVSKSLVLVVVAVTFIGWL